MLSLHGRYTNGPANIRRVTIAFRRQDLLWKTATALVGPGGSPRVKELLIRRAAEAIGPTILDMMMREVIPVTVELREQVELPEGIEEAAMWKQRPIETLWPKPPDDKRPPKRMPHEHPKALDHPFQRGLASGGRVLLEEAEFVMVEKVSTVSISEMTLKLAIGMTGTLADAYTRIGAKAAQKWAEDLARARKLWARIQAVGELYEDHTVAELRPLSSISQETELHILREACTWLGVDPDQDFSRPPGRPHGNGVERGEAVLIRITADQRLSGELAANFHGLNVGTELSDLTESVLVDLLGALRGEQYRFDVDLLEAFLDASVTGWRERAASAADEPGQVSDRYDPYEVLGVARDATLDEITRAYRQIMQRVHPDVSNLGSWFAQVAAAAYRTIRQERGEQP